jgi:(p)ppGpp synthase/HD superfamily hydrolase
MMDERVPTAPEPVLGERFVEALRRTVALHGDQARKGGRIPYLGHLLGVASLVLDAGGTEDQAIAALLHDALEDRPGLVSQAALTGEFGAEVARIVVACSDVTPDQLVDGRKPPWSDRKHAYVAHLAEQDDAVLLVSLADKLHNARSLRMDLETYGPGVWERFNAGPGDQLWYQRALLAVFQARLREPAGKRLLTELAAEVDRIAALAPAGGVELSDGG